MTPQRLVRSVNLHGLGPASLAALVTLSAGLAACGGDPFIFPWELNPDTVLPYSLARPALNLQAACSFHDRRRVRGAASPAWRRALY